LPAFLAPSRPRHQRTEGRPGLSSTPCCRAVRCSRGP
jgi:hypothetical protein